MPEPERFGDLCDQGFVQIVATPTGEVEGRKGTPIQPAITIKVRYYWYYLAIQYPYQQSSLSLVLPLTITPSLTIRHASHDYLFIR